MLQIKLKELREKSGLSQTALARKMNVSQSTIGMWESGKNKPEFANLEKLCHIFNVSANQLLGNDLTSESYPEAPSPSVPGSKWIPVLGRVAAGTPIEAIEDILDYEEITPEMAASGDFFALQINGDSMEPKISDKDVVIVRKQDDCESGDIAVVLVNGEDATVKRIKKRPEGIILAPTNPQYEPMFYSNTDIEKLPIMIIGKVVELRAKF